MLRMALILLVLASFAQPTRASDQDSVIQTVESPFEFVQPAPLSFLLPYVPTYMMYFTEELKSFIRSEDFDLVRANHGDIRAIDAIFVKAMRLTGDNSVMALLLSCLATFNHEIVGLRVPLLSIAFPLTGESREDFRARVARLPRKLYEDTPPGGDRDKIQHFFGSAFLACLFESRDVAERFGDFVEQGEDAVIIDGALDDRDIRANRQGQEFGLALLTDPHMYPSAFLRTAVAGNAGTSGNPNKMHERDHEYYPCR